jgi:hypothetical protein
VTLHVASFGGGVVLAGGADTRHIDEVLAADAVDIGPRGALVCASDVSDYLALTDGQGTRAARVHGFLSAATIADVYVVAVIEGATSAGAPAYLVRLFARDGATVAETLAIDTVTYPTLDGAAGGVIPPLASGACVTGVVSAGTYASNPGVAIGLPTVHRHILLVNIGAREGAAPNTAPGLYVLLFDAPTGIAQTYPIQNWDALGTGPFGVLTQGGDGPGVHAKQLYFRGIASYNGYVFGWGFDHDDRTAGDGPCRVMFSNPGDPLTWGNDNDALAFTANGKARRDPPVSRPFTDSDAVVLGSAGESIRAALPIFGKLFFGTNRGLHFLQGYGRDTFLTNGTTPVMQAFNVTGPGALVEGPDRLLYGVGDQGLWRYSGGAVPEPLFERVTDFAGRSPGWFDCLWTDAGRAVGVPGRTNRDLVWTAVDWERHQVLVGIPYCDTALGSGPGADTLVVKYHVLTGGFTRQAFPGLAITAAGYFRAAGQARATRLLGTTSGGGRRCSATRTAPPRRPRRRSRARCRG